MQKIRTSIFLTLLLIVGLTSSLWAAPIGVTNSRPGAIGSSNEPSLQKILNTLAGPGVLNANTDQNTAAIFKNPFNPPAAGILPILSCEYSSLANTQQFGIFTAYDTAGPISRVTIFNGAASPGSASIVQWTNDDTISISGGPGVNSGTFSGINKNFFGFFYEADGLPGNPVIYTVDALNPGGVAGALAYNVANNAGWIFAFDDTKVDFDYNDLVVKIESIAPAPIPGGFLLLGTGFLCLVGMRQRRIWN